MLGGDGTHPAGFPQEGQKETEARAGFGRAQGCGFMENINITVAAQRKGCRGRTGEERGQKDGERGRRKWAVVRE